MIVHVNEPTVGESQATESPLMRQVTSVPKSFREQVVTRPASVNSLAPHRLRSPVHRVPYLLLPLQENEPSRLWSQLSRMPTCVPSQKTLQPDSGSQPRCTHISHKGGNPGEAQASLK